MQWFSMKTAYSVLGIMLIQSSAFATPERTGQPIRAEVSDSIVLNIADLPQGEPDPSLPHVVVVDKTNHRTYVLELDNGRLERVFDCANAVGKPSTPTPTGRRTVKGKALDPIWTPPPSLRKKYPHPIGPYSRNPNNPIGVAFIDTGGHIGLHGTNAPDKIGQSVSTGCIRHLNEDVMQIYPLVRPGTPVYIVPTFDGTTISWKDFD